MFFFLFCLPPPRLPYGGLWSGILCVARRVGGSNGDWIMYQMQIPSIVRCRWRLPSIFQLPWKFHLWDTGFVSVHTLNTTRRPRRRDRHPSPLSLSLFHSFLSSRSSPTPFYPSPRDALLRRLQFRSTIESRSAIGEDFTRPWNAPCETMAREFTISPRTKELIRIVPRSMNSLLHRT